MRVLFAIVVASLLEGLLSTFIGIKVGYTIFLSSIILLYFIAKAIFKDKPIKTGEVSESGKVAVDSNINPAPRMTKVWKVLGIVLLIIYFVCSLYLDIHNGFFTIIRSEPQENYQFDDPKTAEMVEALSPDSYDEMAFKTHYPMVWGYIQKNAEYPNTYLATYMNIWGKLQKYHGDGIPFDTLNSYEQTLVNYPKIGSFIYFANIKSSTYHSTKECYELLKSENVVARKAEKLTEFDPCSKCVGDTQHVNKVRRMNGYK